jgi:hypothetical protein
MAGTSSENYISNHINFNEWIKQKSLSGDPTFSLFDTTNVTVDETVNSFTGWVNKVVK